MELGSLAQWASATATFLAVLAALFKEDLLGWWRRPRLTATIRLGPPDCVKSPGYVVDVSTGRIMRTFESYYFRLWIQNKGKQRADQVQVYAAKLSRKRADGTFGNVDTFLPMNLRWAHAKDPTQPQVFENINPHMGKHCDLENIPNPAHEDEELPDVPACTPILHLDLEVKPSTRSNLVPPGVYRLLLRIAAANAAPVEKELEITLTGDWNGEEARMFSRCVGVRELDSLGVPCRLPP